MSITAYDLATRALDAAIELNRAEHGQSWDETKVWNLHRVLWQEGEGLGLARETIKGFSDLPMLSWGLLSVTALRKLAPHAGYTPTLGGAYAILRGQAEMIKRCASRKHNADIRRAREFCIELHDLILVEDSRVRRDASNTAQARSFDVV